MTTFSRPLLAAVASLGLLTASPAAAKDVETAANVDDTPARNIFAAAYFDAFAPRTALDMVGQVPGFSIRTGDSGKRGLGQGGANILVNGERLTGKANAFDTLEQILSSNVESIAILDGAALSIPGLSGQVADITVRADSFSGSWEWNPEFRDGLQPNWTNGRINISGKRGNLDWSGFVRDFAFRGGADGTELRRDADGVLFEQRKGDIDNYGDRPGVGANLAWKPREGHTANLDVEYALFDFNRKADYVRQAVTPRGEDLITLSENSEDEVYWEAGADYELPLLGGTLKAIGYLEREDSPTRSTFSVFDPQTGFSGASRFEQQADEAESILRGEYGWTPSEGRSWQIGVEGAFNSLDVAQTLSSREPGGDVVANPVDRFTVSEDRYEATLTHSRPFGAKWDVQASVGAELSELSQSRGGVESEPRDFVRPKGFVSATYKPKDGLNIRGKVEREVGQLSFFDFVASVDLQDDLGRVANPDLVPAQSWLGSLEFDRDFGQGNVFKIEVYGALIEDIVDRIPIGLNGDAIGNLDSASRYGFDIEGTLKGERWGLEGMQLDYEFDWRHSRVDDPLTGATRRLNGDKDIAYEISFRHDIPGTQLAYGAFLERFIGADSVRTFSIERFGFDQPLDGVYVEHKDILGIKARLQLVNLGGTVEEFDRTVFDGRRDRGIIDRTEENDFDFGTIVQFRLSGEF